jgi:hypothetical protein
VNLPTLLLTLPVVKPKTPKWTEKALPTVASISSLIWGSATYRTNCNTVNQPIQYAEPPIIKEVSIFGKFWCEITIPGHAEVYGSQSPTHDNAVNAREAAARQAYTAICNKDGRDPSDRPSTSTKLKRATRSRKSPRVLPRSSRRTSQPANRLHRAVLPFKRLANRCFLCVQGVQRSSAR